MRQFNRLRMFMHAEDGVSPGFTDGDIIGFVRLGNDLSENYYQIEIPLQESPSGSLNAQSVWPVINEIDLPISALETIKSLSILNGTLGSDQPIFYDVVNDDVNEESVNEFSPLDVGEQRISIKGNPNFGDIRTLMIGVKNPSQDNMDVCAEVWFNELRLSDMDNEGGWAATLAVDTNVADFMNISATARQSTSGFGNIEQGPSERDKIDKKQYDIISNINVGQLFPETWGLNIPLNYGQGEEYITPEFDQQYRDITLSSRIDQAESQQDKDAILRQSEDYTKRKSVNLIGVNKQRTNDEKTPRFYDVENLTFNYSYNEVNHRDYEIENMLDQNVRAGVNYNFNFNTIKLEPLKKNDSIFNSKYLKILKDFNINLLPSSISINTDYIRQFNKQKFREIDLTQDNIGIQELFRRNYSFDFQLAINYPISENLTLNYNLGNNNIVRNYFIDNQINGMQDPELDVWDRFFDIGDPNRQVQQVAINYDLPLNKIPTFNFIKTSYSYTGDFQWQKGSDLFGNLTLNGQTYDLGNSISNANTHNINSVLDMQKLYRYLGLTKFNRSADTKAVRGFAQNNSPKKTNPILKSFIDLITTVKRIQINYSCLLYTSDAADD